MSIEKGFNNIQFSRLKDLVHLELPEELDEMTYTTNATNFRLAILNSFGKRDFNATEKISEDEDTCLTYRGYIKFLETDLKTVFPIGEMRSKNKYKKGVSYIAKQMLFRGDVSYLSACLKRRGASISLVAKANTFTGLFSRNSRKLLRPSPTFHPPIQQRKENFHQSVANRYRIHNPMAQHHRHQIRRNSDNRTPSHFRGK